MFDPIGTTHIGELYSHMGMCQGKNGKMQSARLGVRKTARTLASRSIGIKPPSPFQVLFFFAIFVTLAVKMSWIEPSCEKIFTAKIGKIAKEIRRQHHDWVLRNLARFGLDSCRAKVELVRVELVRLAVFPTPSGGAGEKGGAADLD
ncbi:MAG TPA: hypothetical protein VMD30_03175 [Tepidisphaeraceae bacterium]|nr:hypothetical protein [Tepidisphaeraceae bacterium]